LPIHGLTIFELLTVCDEFGIKSLDQLDFKSVSSLTAMRFMERAAVLGLNFPSIDETWTVEKIRREFADIGEVARVFATISNLTRPASAEKSRKVTPYR
jgi:hypothetical protein